MGFIKTGLLIMLVSAFSINVHAHSFYLFRIIYEDSLNCDKEKYCDDLKFQKDIFDLLRGLYKTKTIGKKDTVIKFGTGPYVSLFPSVSYSLATGWKGVLAANISFYLEKKKDKLSSITAYGNYSEFKQYWITVNSNIFSEHPKLNFVGDWRIYKFPTNTFGLGSSSKKSDEEKIDYLYLKIYQKILYGIVPDFFAGIGYMLDYYWNVKEYNPSVNIPSGFERYGRKRFSTSSGLSLNFLYDNRKNSINPEKGLYSSFQYRHNLAFLGSNQNWQSLLIEIRKYFKIPGSSKNTLAFWSYNNFVLNGNPPYLDLPSNGWDAFNNTGRGYIQGRFRGKNMIYLETEYRFTLTQNGLLGGVVFTNFQTYSEWPSNNFYKAIPGGGFGIRIKLNKYTRTNLAIDYGFGLEKSRGIFINIGEFF